MFIRMKVRSVLGRSLRELVLKVCQGFLIVISVSVSGKKK